MKIDAISAKHSISNTDLKNRKVSKILNSRIEQSGYTTISFKGGNKDNVLHVVGEAKPYFQKGGVATVVDDYLRLNNASATEKGKVVVVAPYYNGLVKYAEPKKNGSDLLKIGVELPRVPEGLPAGHPFKGKEGQPVYVKADLSKNKLMDVLVKNPDQCWLLEEVSSKEMSWGLQEKAPTKLLKVVSNAKKGPEKNDVFMVFTEATAFYPEPYAQGQYSSAVKPIVNSWGGDPYAKYNKAVVEYMEDISKRLPGFDPGTVVCSDSQAAYVTHYMAQKNAAGIEYFKGKKPIQIGHNLGDGYIGLTSARNMLVNLDILKPDELKALTDSSELREAIVKGGEDEAAFFEKFLSGMQAKNKLSAMSIATHYGNVGYLPTWGVVSQGYVDEIVKNKEIAPFLFEDIKDLHAKGVLVGRTNPLNTTNLDAFHKTGMDGFDSEWKIKLKDGSEETIKPLKFFTEAEKSTLTLEQLKAQKRENKINFLKRYLHKYDGAQLYDKDGKLGEAKSGSAKIRGKDIPMVSEIDLPKYIGKLEKGEDVNVIVSWGRGDFQKAFDEVLNGFKKYVLTTGDKNAILVMGGDLQNDKAEGQRVKDIAELLNKDEIFKGRVMLMDGFAPGRPMAQMGDCALFPSRTAPCELTDLEAKQHLCTPIVPNGQGMRQKNFDASISEEAKMADAFKTKHQFFDSREAMLEAADADTKASFNKVFNKLKSDIENKYKVALGKDSIPPETLEKFIEISDDYKDAMRKLRDEVMTDDIAATLKRCLIEHKNDDVAKTVMKNQVNGKYGWEENQAITRSAVPTGELYRSDFQKVAKNVTEKDIIGYGISKPKGHASISDGTSFGSKLSDFFKSKGGKWTAGIAAAAAILGLGYSGYKKGIFSTAYENDKVDKSNLSEVV